MVKTFSVFYGTRNFIIMFERTRNYNFTEPFESIPHAHILFNNNTRKNNFMNRNLLENVMVYQLAVMESAVSLPLNYFLRQMG